MNLKSLLGSLLMICTFSLLSAQEGEVFAIVEEMPRFPGCELAPEDQIKKCAQARMFDFIRQNIKYPKEAYDAGVTGRSIVQFVVNEDGSLSDIKIPRPNHPALDEEAKRIVRTMPFWRPGKQRGKAVKVKITLPIKFQLEIAKERFTSIADLFCEKYMAEFMTVEKLQALAQSPFENKEICGMNGMSAKLVKITMTYTVGDKDTLIESADGSWTKSMNDALANIKTGESISLDFNVAYEVAEGKSFVQNEYRAIVAK